MVTLLQDRRLAAANEYITLENRTWSHPMISQIIYSSIEPTFNFRPIMVDTYIVIESHATASHIALL